MSDDYPEPPRTSNLDLALLSEAENAADYHDRWGQILDKEVFQQLETKLTEGEGKLEVRSVTTAELNNVAVVADEQELKRAIGTHNQIALADSFTWSGSGVAADIGSADFHLDGRGHTITRAEGGPTRLLDLTTTGTVSIRNITVDGNRQANTSADKEIRIVDASQFFTSDMTVLNNCNWALSLLRCDNVTVNNFCVRTNPAPSEELGGLDGIHPVDCSNITITNPNIISGDDAVAIETRDESIENISVMGGTLSAPYHANGFKLMHDGPADENTTLDTVSVDTTIKNCHSDGIIIYDSTDTATTPTIDTLRIGGTIRNTGDRGILLNIPIRNAKLDATIEDTGSWAIGVADAAVETLHISGTIKTEAYGVRLGNAGDTDIRIDITYDGMGSDSSGVYLDGADYVSITGVFKNATNAVIADDSQYVSVSGAVIREMTGHTIWSRNGSDFWTVSGNTSHNASGANLAGANNVTGHNNWN